MDKSRSEEDVKHLIEDYGYEDVIIFSNPDYADAFVGISEDNRAIYNFVKMVGCLMEEDGMTYIEAIEFIEYNTIRALPYMGDGAPIILHPLYYE